MSRDSVDEIETPTVPARSAHSAAARPFKPLALLSLGPGTVLEGRFVIERLVGRGGMGMIYRAQDLLSHEPAAIKVLNSERLDDARRFAREIATLSELKHPNIVRYIAHGAFGSNALFLAMEWLEGEDLSARLARAPLTLEQSISVVRQACAGVAAAHARGVVHRDLKPSNLFLLDDACSDVKVLDFGIAREGVSQQKLTETGALVGTVGYMSPEQAMAAATIDARTDVFALGCVLFECLTGRPAFQGASAVAVLAKVLSENAPSVSELRPELSPDLDALMARVLDKSPSRRPDDARALLRALDALSGQRLADASRVQPIRGLGLNEQRVVSVVLATPRENTSARASAAMLDLSEVRRLISHFGAQPIPMSGGGLLMVFGSENSATERAHQAARSALRAAAVYPEHRFAIATGRAQVEARFPVGAAIDCAAALLTSGELQLSGVLVDAVTAGLLEAWFLLERDGSALVLTAEADGPRTGRLLLGRPSPFVGRDKEIAWLELTLQECVSDRVARAVLVTAPPGQGKSRLRHEFTRRVRTHGEVFVLLAQAGPLGAGSAFVLVRQLVRAAFGVREGAPSHAQRVRIRARLDRLLDPGEASSVADFLAELIGIGETDSPSPELRTARSDPQVMGSWLRRAVLAWLRAECERRPLLLILEDLQWGDLASVGYLGEALRELARYPFMVLAVGRPEVHVTFPSLWASVAQELRLTGLTPRASERLVRSVLGDRLTKTETDRIVDLADGNAFYLEELIRHRARDGNTALPETLLAMAQARLDGLDAEERRVMRAASIFGESFWCSAVACVLNTPEEVIWPRLRRLLDLELLVPAARDSRFPGEHELAFRHSLLRETAYATLTDSDRATGHQSAAEWLEGRGETNAAAIATHFLLAAQHPRALPWLVRAAREALDSGHTDDAIELAQRGLRGGALGVERGSLLAIQGSAYVLRGQWRESAGASQAAMKLLAQASAPWFAAAASTLTAAIFLSDDRMAADAVQAVLSSPSHDEVSGPHGAAIFYASTGLIHAKKQDIAESLIASAEAMMLHEGSRDLVFDVWVRCARGYAQLLRDELAPALNNFTIARALARRADAATCRAVAAALTVAVLADIGHLERAEKIAEEAWPLYEHAHLDSWRDWMHMFLCWMHVDAGRAQPAVVRLRALVASKSDGDDRRVTSIARGALAWALHETGALREARDEAAIALLDDDGLEVNRAALFAALAFIALDEGSPDEALQHALHGFQSARYGATPWSRSMLSLAHARALWELGRKDEARDRIHTASERILRLAASLPEPELSQSFRCAIPANARTLELAREWLADLG